MSVSVVNVTYEPYSKEPEYIEANRSFLRAVDLTSCSRLLDLACGTCVMTELALKLRPGLNVVGLDLSRECLLLAKEHFTRIGPTDEPGRLDVQLLQASADCLPLADCSMDGVIMGNAIHLLPDRGRLLSEVRRVLRCGGLFAFNGSFYAGTMVPGTERFYHEWVKQALLYVIARDRQLRGQGREGIRRRRGNAPPAFSSRWLSPDEWAMGLAEHGFDVRKVSQRTVTMTQRSFETIGAYAGLARVLLSGYPVDLASEALQATARSALAAIGMETVPRNWLEVVAVRL